MSATIDKVAWVHLRDGKILCVRSKGKDTYYLPGGKREPGEADAEVLQREIEEELSVHINLRTSAYFGTFEDQAHGKSHGVLVKMTCYTAEYEGQLSPASEIDGMEWLTYDDRPRVSAVVQTIFDKLFELKLLA